MGEYDDILHLPHHTSPRRARMSMLDRAAQFSPFAALTGYEDAIEETGRLTDSRMELGEYARSILDQKQQRLAQIIGQQPEITVTYFLPDERKSGGSYEKVTGNLKKLDFYHNFLVLADGTRIPLFDISDIEGDCLL